jgi:hypothetical protein
VGARGRERAVPAIFDPGCKKRCRRPSRG